MISIISGEKLPLELQVGFFHLFERELHALARSGFKSDHACGEALEGPSQVALIFDGLAQDNFDFLPHEALKLARLAEFTLDTGRTYFQAVASPRNDIFDVQDGPDMMRNEFAIGQRNPLRSSRIHSLACSRRAVYKNAQNSIAAAAHEVHIDDLDALAGANPFRDLDYLVYDSLTVRHLAYPSDRK